MVDSVSRARRSQIMSLIPVRDTTPERVVKRALWAAGFRYGRSRSRKLPGSPDLVFPALRAVVFVHGCFWHGHLCSLGRTPKTNTEFWTAKIAGNRERDARVTNQLRKDGWRVITIWECCLPDGIRQAKRTLLRYRAAIRRQLV